LNKKGNVPLPTHGLNNMQERVYLLDGTVKLNSAVGLRTEIFVQIPLNKPVR